MVVAIVAVDVGLYVWVGAKVGPVPTSVVAAIGGDGGGIIALVRDGVGGGRSTEAGAWSPLRTHFPHDF